MAVSYALIDSTTLVVKNIGAWDGVAPWQTPAGQFAVPADGLHVGDSYTGTTPGFLPTGSALPAAAQTSVRNAAKALATDPSPQDVALRAILLVLLDEINTIRTNAALGLAARTVAQLKAAVATKIDSGAAD